MMTMASGCSKYACDECRTRKIKCSRELSGCTQCLENSRQCIYSRSGTIRRKRKRKRSLPLREGRVRASDVTEESYHDSRDSDARGLQESRSTGDIQRRPHESGPSFTSTYPLLPYTIEQFWQDPMFIDRVERMRNQGNQLFTFEKEAAVWTRMFDGMIKKGNPMFLPVPPEVLGKISFFPEHVSQKAYLVIFYGIILTEESSNPLCDESTKTKLRWNLWICLNDARLLLEPSDMNIQALLMLAIHVQDFHTPSLCWMIVSNACRMLQALGINTSSLDKETRDRRIALFWFLSGIDRSLALIFERPPTFPRASYKSIPIPSVRQLTNFHPHIASSSTDEGRTGLFGAHLLHNMYLLSGIMVDIWSSLFDRSDTPKSTEQVQKELDDWYETTNKVLEASLLAEKPLLDASEERQLQLGIRHLEFQYLWLTVLLTRRDRHQHLLHETYGEHDCINVSRRCLQVLDNLVSDSRDVYNGIVWQLLFQPFTPFFALLDHVRMLAQARHGIESNNNSNVSEMEESLTAMECLVTFLDRMTTRHPLAEKLCDVANEHYSIAKRLMATSHQSSTGIQSRASRGSLNGPPLISTTTSAPTGTSPSLATPRAPVLQSIDKQSDFLPVFDPFDDYNFDFGGFDWFAWDNNNNIGNNLGNVSF